MADCRRFESDDNQLKIIGPQEAVVAAAAEHAVAAHGHEDTSELREGYAACSSPRAHTSPASGRRSRFRPEHP